MKALSSTQRRFKSFIMYANAPNENSGLTIFLTHHSLSPADQVTRSLHSRGPNPVQASTTWTAAYIEHRWDQEVGPWITVLVFDCHCEIPSPCGTHLHSALHLNMLPIHRN
jgi:hypothetical protein